MTQTFGRNDRWKPATQALAALRRVIDLRAYRFVFFSLVLLLALWWAAGRWYQARLIAVERAELSTELALQANSLSLAVNRRFARLQGLYSFVVVEAQEPDFEAKFERFAALLHANAQGLRNIAVAPDGEVRYVYPLDGNESVLGYRPAQDERAEVREDVEQAIRTQLVVLSGPINLVQGGYGLVARQAIFLEAQYWGLVNLVLDLDPILMEAGMDSPPQGLLLALRDDDQDLFFGQEQVWENDPVIEPVMLPEGKWELAGAPAGGWSFAVADELKVFQFSSLIIVGLLTGLIQLAAGRQAQLQKSVDQRTHELARTNRRLAQELAHIQETEKALQEREMQYLSVFEAAQDGFFINDLETGRLVEFNPAAAQMHGYTVEEFRALQPLEFIHPDSHALFEAYIDAVRAGQEYRCRATDLHKDGTHIHVDVFGTGFQYQGRPHTLAVVRDVTEEEHAYSLLEARVEERTRQLATLLELTREVTAMHDLDPLLGLILDQLQRVVDFTGARVITLEDDHLRVRATRGPIPVEKILGQIYSKDNMVDLTIASTRKPLLIPDVRADTPMAIAFRQDLGERFETLFAHIRSWMGVPLVTNDRYIGMLALDHMECEHYTPEQAELAMAFASQVAVAVENARLVQEVRKIAVHEERGRLARDLHDSVTQSLYSLTLFAEAARRLAEAGDLKRVEDYMARVGETSLQCLKEMRLLVYQLRPPALAGSDLASALQTRLDAVERRAGMNVELNLEQAQKLPAQIEESLFWIAQEALNNTLKHAGARSLKVSLLVNKSQARLEIDDDGRGFDIERAELDGGMGLNNMRARAEREGARFELASQPGSGTHLKIEWMLPTHNGLPILAPDILSDETEKKVS